MPSPTTTRGAQCQSLTTHVVLQWAEQGPNGQEEPRFLTAPDPSDAKIVFKSDISATRDGDASEPRIGVFIRLHIPVKLKKVSGRSPIHIRIHPSHVQSCTFAVAAEVPEAISAASPCQQASLSMTLSTPVRVVVPHNMAPSSPAKSRASGRVLDAIRSLTKATRLVLYVPASQAPRAHLQHLSRLLSNGTVEALPAYTELSSLFGGAGGRIWEVEASVSATLTAEDEELDTPPPYREVSPGPPAPPISDSSLKGRDGKRRRQSSGSDSEVHQTKKLDTRASPSPRTWHSEKAQVQEPSVSHRLSLLEALVQAQALQISKLTIENQEQRKRIDDYEAELAAVRLEISRVDRQVEKLELEAAEQRDDIVRLDGDVQYCLEREDDITEAAAEAATEAVTERISERGLSAANIIFTLGEG